MSEIQRVWDANFQVYGAVKVWRQLNRKGLEVAHRTVKRLMQRMGPGSSRRCKRVRTTVPGSSAPYSLDRVNRQFRADRLNQLWVADFTYVPAWQMRSSMTTDFVLDALEQALHARNQRVPVGLFTIQTAACNTYPCATRNDWPRPEWIHRSAVMAIATTTPSPRPLMCSTRRRLSTAVAPVNSGNLWSLQRSPRFPGSTSIG